MKQAIIVFTNKERIKEKFSKETFYESLFEKLNYVNFETNNYYLHANNKFEVFNQPTNNKILILAKDSIPENELHLDFFKEYEVYILKHSLPQYTIQAHKIQNGIHDLNGPTHYYQDVFNYIVAEDHTKFDELLKKVFNPNEELEKVLKYLHGVLGNDEELPTLPPTLFMKNERDEIKNVVSVFKKETNPEIRRNLLAEITALTLDNKFK